MGNKDSELRDEDWECLINDFDKNGDGTINFTEFKNMMYQLHVNNIKKANDRAGAAGIVDD